MATITNIEQELLRFADLVERMRSAQKGYFKTRDKSTLVSSKNLEKLVDLEIERYKTGRLIP